MNLRSCVCDVCGFTCFVYENTSSKGWCTLTEDHTDLYCPDCNPYISRTTVPDQSKLSKCEAAQRRLGKSVI